MIADLMMIKVFKSPPPVAPTEEDRERERRYGVSFYDVYGYLSSYRRPLHPPADYPRSALNDETNWAKTKQLIEAGELERWEISSRKFVRRLRSIGRVRLFFGVILIFLAYYLNIWEPVWNWVFGLYGFYLIAAGIVRGWYLVRLYRAHYDDFQK